jgi:hypothetical protein
MQLECQFCYCNHLTMKVEESYTFPKVWHQENQLWHQASGRSCLSSWAPERWLHDVPCEQMWTHVTMHRGSLRFLVAPQNPVWFLTFFQSSITGCLQGLTGDKGRSFKYRSCWGRVCKRSVVKLCEVEMHISHLAVSQSVSRSVSRSVSSFNNAQSASNPSLESWQVDGRLGLGQRTSSVSGLEISDHLDIVWLFDLFQLVSTCFNFAFLFRSFQPVSCFMCVTGRFGKGLLAGRT